MKLTDRLQHAWNAFTNRDPTPRVMYGQGYSSRPDVHRFARGNERSIVTSVINRIAIDVAAIKIQHVRLDENERYKETIDSDFNSCLTLEANIDQTGRALVQDICESMMDEGVVAIVPTDTSTNPKIKDSFKIHSLRAGKITEWFAQTVRVELYDEQTCSRKEVILPKKMVAIVQNPLYAIMNEPNSTMQRLIRKLNLLDITDEKNSTEKLDLIIQLPYVVKGTTKKAQAEQRRKDIEMQLSGSKYGIAYTDGAEKITQLNRAVENNLMPQIEYLTSMLYGQLGITKEVMDGTADEKTMENYYNRTIEPIISAIVDEMKRKFLTKTARSQNQSILFFRDPFKLVPATEMANIADKFTRNEILTPNEIRQIVGIKPSDDVKADELRNRNISQSNEEIQANVEDQGQFPLETTE